MIFLTTFLMKECLYRLTSSDIVFIINVHQQALADRMVAAFFLGHGRQQQLIQPGYPIRKILDIFSGVLLEVNGQNLPDKHLHILPLVLIHYPAFLMAQIFLDIRIGPQALCPGSLQQPSIKVLHSNPSLSQRLLFGRILSIPDPPETAVVFTVSHIHFY